MEDDPCAFFVCLEGRHCIDDGNGSTFCGECESDDEWEFGCQDFCCRDCGADSDCGPGRVCDTFDGSCFDASCDFDFSCDAAQGEVCLDEQCEVLPCAERADPTCVDEGLLCSESDTCQLADVTGCGFGPQRSGGGPLLLEASLTRAAEEDARCPASAAWRVNDTAVFVSQGRPQIFLAEPLAQTGVQFHSEVDDTSFDFPVERGGAVVCIAMPAAPFQAQVNILATDGRSSNGVCVDVVDEMPGG